MNINDLPPNEIPEMNPIEQKENEQKNVGLKENQPNIKLVIVL